MVYLFLANGFEEIEALCPVDLLRRAKVDVVTVGIGGKMVSGSHGIKVEADVSEAEALNMLSDGGCEMVILPGGLPGATNLDESETVDKFLSYVKANDLPYAAICAAPLVLGHRGMLENKNAVCYPGFEKELYGANITDAPVVRDGKAVCGRAMGSATRFALEIISLLRGNEVRDQIERSILL